MNDLKGTLDSVKHFITQDFIYCMNEKQFDGIIFEDDSIGFHWWKNNNNLEDTLFRIQNSKDSKHIYYFKINKRYGLRIRQIF